MDSTGRAANLRPDRRGGRRDALRGDVRSARRLRGDSVRSPSPRSSTLLERAEAHLEASGMPLGEGKDLEGGDGVPRVRGPGDAAVDKRTTSAEGAAQGVFCAERRVGLHRLDGSEGDRRPRCPSSRPRSAFPSLFQEGSGGTSPSRRRPVPLRRRRPPLSSVLRNPNVGRRVHRPGRRESPEKAPRNPLGEGSPRIEPGRDAGVRRLCE